MVNTSKKLIFIICFLGYQTNYSMDFALQCLIENHTVPSKALITSQKTSEFEREIPSHLVRFLTKEIENSIEPKRKKIERMRVEWKKWVNKMSRPFAVLRVLPKDVQKRIAYYLVKDHIKVGQIYATAINSLQEKLGFSSNGASDENILQKLKELERQKREIVPSQKSHWLTKWLYSFFVRKTAQPEYVVPDSSQIAEVSQEKFLIITDKKENWVRSFQAHKAPITHVLLTADQRFIISASQEKTLCAWDSYTFKKISTVQVDVKKIVAANGNYFIVLTKNNKLHLYDHEGKIIRSTDTIKGIGKLTVNKKHNICVFAGQHMCGVWKFNEDSENIRLFRLLKKSDIQIADISTYDDEIAILYSIQNWLKSKIETWDVALGNKLVTIEGALPDKPCLVGNWIVHDWYACDLKRICALSLTPFLSAFALHKDSLARPFKKKTNIIAYNLYLREIAKYCNNETVEIFKNTLKDYFNLRQQSCCQ